MDGEKFVMTVRKTLCLFFAFCLAFVLFFPTGYFVFSTSNSLETPQKEKASQDVIVYVINLDRSRSRYNYVWPFISQLGFPVQRISAVEGRDLSEREIQNTVDRQQYKIFLGADPRSGTIGCSLSHIKTWQTFLESDFQFALICEDDISFSPPQLSKVVRNLIKPSYTPYWDINSFEVQHRGTPLTLKTLDEGRKLVTYLTVVSHTGAYLITRTAARRLLAKALPIKMPIDHYFTRSWEFDLKFTGIEPRLVTQSYGDSNINPPSSPHSSPEAKSASSIQRVCYIVQSQIIRFLYNLKTYLLLKLSDQYS